MVFFFARLKFEILVHTPRWYVCVMLSTPCCVSHDFFPSSFSMISRGQCSIVARPCDNPNEYMVYCVNSLLKFIILFLLFSSILLFSKVSLLLLLLFSFELLMLVLLHIFGSGSSGKFNCFSLCVRALYFFRPILTSWQFKWMCKSLSLISIYFHSSLIPFAPYCMTQLTIQLYI